MAFSGIYSWFGNHRLNSFYKDSKGQPENCKSQPIYFASYFVVWYLAFKEKLFTQLAAKLPFQIVNKLKTIKIVFPFQFLLSGLRFYASFIINPTDRHSFLTTDLKERFQNDIKTCQIISENHCLIAIHYAQIKRNPE